MQHLTNRNGRKRTVVSLFKMPSWFFLACAAILLCVPLTVFAVLPVILAALGNKVFVAAIGTFVLSVAASYTANQIPDLDNPESALYVQLIQEGNTPDDILKCYLYEIYSQHAYAHVQANGVYPNYDNQTRTRITVNREIIPPLDEEDEITFKEYEYTDVAKVTKTNVASGNTSAIYSYYNGGLPEELVEQLKEQNPGIDPRTDETHKAIDVIDADMLKLTGISQEWVVSLFIPENGGTASGFFGEFTEHRGGITESRQSTLADIVQSVNNNEMAFCEYVTRTDIITWNCSDRFHLYSKFSLTNPLLPGRLAPIEIQQPGECGTYPLILQYSVAPVGWGRWNEDGDKCEPEIVWGVIPEEPIKNIVEMFSFQNDDTFYRIEELKNGTGIVNGGNGISLSGSATRTVENIKEWRCKYLNMGDEGRDEITNKLLCYGEDWKGDHVNHSVSQSKFSKACGWRVNTSEEYQIKNIYSVLAQSNAVTEEMIEEIEEQNNN